MTKAQIFKKLHEQSLPFILPNAWNGGSARLIEMAGFKAVATTSAGIAFSHGLADGGFLDPELMFEEMAKIVAAVSIPVTTDIEIGYGNIAKTIERVKAFGSVGANIEDTDGRFLENLFEIKRACEQITDAKQAGGDDFVINARVDTYLVGHPDALAQSIERGQAYVEAGADCVFIPGVTDKDDIKKLVKEIPGPINILGGVSQHPLNLADYRECGVARISTGGSLMRATFATLENSLKEMMQTGDFTYATHAISDARMNEMLAK
jgi:2-methylisocitrate lyase-like PEP mutase family enzyme